MTVTERRYLRLTVLIGVAASSAFTFFIIVAYGAFAPVNYTGALSSAANMTGWNTAGSLFGEASLFELLVPVTIIAVIIIGVLLYLLTRSALLAGMS